MGIGLLNICVRFFTHQPIKLRRASYTPRKRYQAAKRYDDYDQRDYD